MKSTYSSNLKDLLKDGYTKKFADYYLGQAKDYESIAAYDKEYSKWALSHGFLADSAYWYGLNEHNYQDYLSDYEYYRVWPLNNWTRIWINDKLTLKHVLGATEFGGLMPDYYYYTSSDGLVPLVDCPIKKRNHSINDFCEVLKIVKYMGCKPCNGTSSIGFYKLSYDGEGYMYNDERISLEHLAEIVNSSTNYVYTEYLTSGGYLRMLNEQIHTLRLVVINPIRMEPRIIGGYLRIPKSNIGAANYLHLEGDAVHDYNIVADIDPICGAWGTAKKIYVDRAEDIKYMPKTELKLAGVIEDYSRLRQMVLGIADRFRNVEYMGFDLCVSSNGFKCMEINSHPGMRHMQIFKSFLADDYTREYFERKIANIDKMTEQQRIIRNAIIR